MGRPKAVNYSKLKDYNLLHTKKTKQYSGVEITGLYPIKETKEYFLSIEVWAFCLGKFKSKKKNFTQELNIPMITDEKTIEFLKENCWEDYFNRNPNSNNLESIELLNKIFPGKKVYYFFELDSIIIHYCNGSFISYDDNGNIEPVTENDIKNQKYFTHKYNRYLHDIPELKKMYDDYHKIDINNNKKEREIALRKYLNAEEEYAFKNNNLNDIFIEIGKNVVCYPVAFSDSTADWFKEKYGKICPYAHAGEIFFVQTEDSIFIQIVRHY